jgi:hypothetical protein
MSSFKKNHPIPKISNDGVDIINQAEDVLITTSKKKYIKEITIPFTQEMSDLLEQIYLYHDGDISRRKLCAKQLVKALRLESTRLN